jgi:hypothetical protein
MNVSLNEIEVTSRRAAVGAGYPQGIAEDAGAALRWLCAAGLPGVEALLAALATPGEPPRTPERNDTIWTWRPATSGGRLSALLLGPSVAELVEAAPTASPGRIVAEGLVAPLLLLPHAARLAGDGSILVEWHGSDGAARLLIHGSELALAPGSVLLPVSPTEITMSLYPTAAPAGLAPTPAAASRRAAIQQGVTIADAAWQALVVLAMLSFVPASAQSRLHGAGAGLVDDD